MKSTMQAKKSCLILAAGFGTRMGEIGKVLPKVMWPVFEQSLLEMQVRFAKSLGYQGRIYINLFHQANQIRSLTNDLEVFSDVIWLEEKPEILDIGGGVHNLASRNEINYKGELLVLNADQFLWFDSHDLENWRNNFPQWDSILISREVNSAEGYNALKLTSSHKLQGIIQNIDFKANEKIITYSGNALINLESLNQQKGPSKFFESVCPFSKNVYSQLSPESDYWDFGTAKRYFESMFKVLDLQIKGEESRFLKFLKEHKIIDLKKISKQSRSYGCASNEVINLSKEEVGEKVSRKIIISGPVKNVDAEPQIIYNEITQFVSL
ncbi:MAG: NTP transferase domain-containing protein [Bacteriovoracaceae bacterium]|nr:NTP transferase domain-containing protein [Bacteriovoracaceae bacterium]